MRKETEEGEREKGGRIRGEGRRGEAGGEKKKTRRSQRRTGDQTQTLSQTPLRDLKAPL